MKKIEAIIKPFKLEDVKEALSDIGIVGMTVSEVSGCGQERGYSETIRGFEYKEDYLPRLKVEIVIHDSVQETAVKMIVEAAKTRKRGDGKVFVSNIEDAIRIRTNERGDCAL